MSVEHLESNVGWENEWEERGGRDGEEFKQSTSAISRHGVCFRVMHVDCAETVEREGCEGAQRCDFDVSGHTAEAQSHHFGAIPMRVVAMWRGLSYANGAGRCGDEAARCRLRGGAHMFCAESGSSCRGV